MLSGYLGPRPNRGLFYMRFIYRVILYHDRIIQENPVPDSDQ